MTWTMLLIAHKTFRHGRNLELFVRNSGNSLRQKENLFIKKFFSLGKPEEFLKMSKSLKIVSTSLGKTKVFSLEHCIWTPVTDFFQLFAKEFFENWRREFLCFEKNWEIFSSENRVFFFWILCWKVLTLI